MIKSWSVLFKSFFELARVERVNVSLNLYVDFGVTNAREVCNGAIGVTGIIDSRLGGDCCCCLIAVDTKDGWGILEVY